MFDTEFVMCDIKGLMGGTLFYQATPCESIKCPPSNTWKLNLLGYIIGLLILLIVGTNIHNDAIRDDICRLLSRIRPSQRSSSLGPETSL